jgi:hypothetical protein
MRHCESGTAGLEMKTMRGPCWDRELASAGMGMISSPKLRSGTCHRSKNVESFKSRNQRRKDCGLARAR